MGATQNKNSCKTAAVVGLLSRGGASRPDVQAPPDGLKSAEAVKPGSILTGQRDEGRLNELARCIRERDREDQQLANVMLAHAVEKGRWPLFSACQWTSFGATARNKIFANAP